MLQGFYDKCARFAEFVDSKDGKQCEIGKVVGGECFLVRNDTDRRHCKKDRRTVYAIGSCQTNEASAAVQSVVFESVSECR